MRWFPEVNFADHGMVDGRSGVCEELHIDDDEPDVVPHEPDRYGEMMCCPPSGHPEGGGSRGSLPTNRK